MATETWAFALWGIYGYGFSFEEPVVIGARKVEVKVTWRGFGWKLQSLIDILTDRIRFRSSRVHHPSQRKGEISLFEVAESLSIGLSGLQTQYPGHRFES